MPRTPAATTPREKAIRLMSRQGGASLAEMTRATGWQPHSARAFISGLRKQGLAITRTRDGKASLYSIARQP